MILHRGDLADAARSVLFLLNQTLGDLRAQFFTHRASPKPELLRQVSLGHLLPKPESTREIRDSQIFDGLTND